MFYKNILVPYDGSDASKKALEAASDFVARDMAQHITVIAVVDPIDGLSSAPDIGAWNTGTFSGDMIEKILLDKKANIEEIIYEFADKVTVILKVGSPKKEIISAIDSEDCDLVIMGSRGLGSFRGALGSVSHAVLHETQVPVFLMK